MIPKLWVTGESKGLLHACATNAVPDEDGLGDVHGCTRMCGGGRRVGTGGRQQLEGRGLMPQKQPILAAACQRQFLALWPPGTTWGSPPGRRHTHTPG